MQLFHQTLEHNLPSILEQGLKKSYSRTWKGKGGCIYLSNMEDTPPFPSNIWRVVLIVDTTGLDVSHPSDWEYICWEDIPPERIKLHHKGETLKPVDLREKAAGN